MVIWFKYIGIISFRLSLQRQPLPASMIARDLTVKDNLVYFSSIMASKKQHNYLRSETRSMLFCLSIKASKGGCTNSQFQLPNFPRKTHIRGIKLNQLNNINNHIIITGNSTPNPNPFLFKGIRAEKDKRSVPLLGVWFLVHITIPKRSINFLTIHVITHALMELEDQVNNHKTTRKMTFKSNLSTCYKYVIYISKTRIVNVTKDKKGGEREKKN